MRVGSSSTSATVRVSPGKRSPMVSPIFSSKTRRASE